MKGMMNRSENERHLLDVFCRWCQMGPRERSVRLEQVVNGVLKEARQDGYTLDFQATRGLRVFTPGGLVVWFVPAPDGEGLEVFVVDVPA